jgi:flagellar basal-body rod modification protein FlgD
MLNTGGIDSFTALNPSERSDSRAKGVEDMGSQDFLALMIAQMENQDPTQPMDQLAFMSQLAQFGTVSGVQELNIAMSDLATSVTGSQAIQASNLIGRSVATESNTGHLAIAGNDEAGNTVLAMRASVDVGPGASGGRFYVHNVQGDIVFSGNLPPRGGVIPVVWDGVDSDGNQLPPGQYQISAEANLGNRTQAARVYGHDRVVSVAIGAGNAVTLNLASGRTIDARDAREIF